MSAKCYTRILFVFLEHGAIILLTTVFYGVWGMGGGEEDGNDKNLALTEVQFLQANIS